MRLGGKTIIQEYFNGKINIEPFDTKFVGPNSIDLHLGDTLKIVKMNAYDIYDGYYIDPRKPREYEQVTIPGRGYLLRPGHLYLGYTKEIAGSKHYIPNLDGRSSIARDGLFVHISAGFGDVGFECQWTLELYCVLPILVFAGERICQAYFDEVTDTSMQYDGNYKAQEGATASKFIHEADT